MISILRLHRLQPCVARCATNWVSCLMNVHLKKVMTPKELMKQFLPDTSAEERKAEREYFIKKFNLGKGDISHGHKGS